MLSHLFGRLYKRYKGTYRLCVLCVDRVEMQMHLPYILVRILPVVLLSKVGLALILILVVGRTEKQMVREENR